MLFAYIAFPSECTALKMLADGDFMSIKKARKKHLSILLKLTTIKLNLYGFRSQIHIVKKTSTAQKVKVVSCLE